MTSELPSLLRLAVPVALSQLGLMAMTLVDMLMVGPLGADALAGAGVGSALAITFSLFGVGCLLGLDPLVSQAFGRGQLGECDRWLVQGIWFALLLGAPLTAGILLMARHLDWLGIAPAIVQHARPFLEALAWGTVPTTVFAAFRQYLAGQGAVRVVTIILFAANGVNVLLNWVLIYGNLGSPVLGVEGSGWSTTGTRVMMVSSLALYAMYRRRGAIHGLSWRPALADIRRVAQLGTPAGLQIVVRTAVFSIATPLAARFGSQAAAAHTIVLNVASFLYMVPIGISVATAVRVGQSYGAGEPSQARRAGWTGMALSGAAMAIVGLVLWAAGDFVMSLFTSDELVAAAGASLLLLAAGFQIFDAVQAAAVGALRGSGETRAALYANLAGHWLVGLPLALLFAFGLGSGLHGLWMGLTCGLMTAAIIVIYRWHGARPAPASRS